VKVTVTVKQKAKTSLNKKAAGQRKKSPAATHENSFNIIPLLNP